MIRFNSAGWSYIDPLHIFTADDWESFGPRHEGNKSEFRDSGSTTGIKIIGLLDDVGFQIRPGQPINTSVFEEATIIE